MHQRACDHGTAGDCKGAHARRPTLKHSSTYMRARQHLHTRQAIAKAVEGANRIYLTAHGHIAIVGQAALQARAPTHQIQRTQRR